MDKVVQQRTLGDVTKLHLIIVELTVHQDGEKIVVMVVITSREGVEPLITREGIYLIYQHSFVFPSSGIKGNCVSILELDEVSS